MSMHKIKMTHTEVCGLIAHKLPTIEASQLSDCFRLGVAWGIASTKDSLKNGDEVYVYNLLAKYHPVKYIGDYKGEGLSSVVELSDGTLDVFDTAGIFKGNLNDKKNHVNLEQDYNKRFKEMLSESREK